MRAKLTYLNTKTKKDLKATSKNNHKVIFNTLKIRSNNKNLLYLNRFLKYSPL